MNKDNENISNHLDEDVELNNSAEEIEVDDNNQFILEDDYENSSDCSNNESIGGGNSPNTFVQSEEVVVEEFVEDITKEDSSHTDELDMVNRIDDITYDNAPINDNDTFTSVGLTDETQTTNENINVRLNSVNDDFNEEFVSDGISDSELNNNQSKTKLNKNKIVIICALILTIGALFIMIKKPFVKEKATVSSSSTLSSEEEKKMKSALDRLMSYYEIDSNGTELKKDIKIDTDDLEKLEKDINTVKDEGTKKELLRLYRQLQEDIVNQSVNTSSIDNLSSSSVVSYNVTFNKA